MRPVAAFALALVAAACASTSGEPGPFAAVHEAVAVVSPTTGNQARGWVRFADVEGGVLVTAEIEGLAPNARHGFHVHEFGDCRGGDGKAAGPHYNPEGHAHAGPDADARHAGDLGNLESDARGVAVYRRTVLGLTVAGARNPVLGRAVILHAREDDLATQPTGNAGDRIGCGVVGVEKPAENP